MIASESARFEPGPHLYSGGRRIPVDGEYPAGRAAFHEESGVNRCRPLMVLSGGGRGAPVLDWLGGENRVALEVLMLLDVLKDKPNEHKTEVGSYFVSNYPPFSVWDRSHLPAIEGVLNSPPKCPMTPLGLYLHIPFCRKRCKFCYFRVYTDKNADEIEMYLSALSKEIDLYAGGRGSGGGSLSSSTLAGGRLRFCPTRSSSGSIERINQHWTWEAAEEVTFECEPGTLKESKLQTIKKIGVTRLSLGVEHFDDEILPINGRAHKSPEIFRAWEWIQERRVSAGQHRPDRGDAGGDGGQVEADGREGDRAGCRTA